MTDWAKKAALIEHMDRRRVALDQILWQAPAIIVAAQAFLLPVLAREGIAISARALILVAGVAASVTGIVGVKRQRVQELFLNKQIWELFRAEGLEVPRRRRHRIPIFMLWIATLAAFIVADVLAFVTEVC